MNKIALVTGASEGIGKEIAKELYNRGYGLVLVARTKSKLESLQKELETAKKGPIWLCPLDLSDKEAAENIYRFTQDRQIEIAVLINNAGRGLYGNLVDESSEAIYRMLMLNSYSLTHLCMKYGQKMKEKKRGHILNLGSLAAYQPVPHIAAYAASKSYVLNFSEALNLELKKYGVHVGCFSPGHTNTEFFRRAQISSSHRFYGLHTRACPKKVAKKSFKRSL